ncbi:hypothetical protein [Myxosarcina sp. GI1]|uniref:hypothetical protein n=1 Tax=Myxosarcina sp. GI1 TaxID=1541065 RepID=UPI000564F97D|nr:hypothetical protein [Myxosarcina sp. GI1]
MEIAIEVSHQLHLLVDTLGLLLIVIVIAANLAENRRVVRLLELVKDKSFLDLRRFSRSDSR